MNQDRQFVRPSTEDRTRGKLHEVKGKIKEVAGKATNNPELEASGNVEKYLGKLQQWMGLVEKAAGK